MQEVSSSSNLLNSLFLEATSRPRGTAASDVALLSWAASTGVLGLTKVEARLKAWQKIIAGVSNDSGVIFSEYTLRQRLNKLVGGAGLHKAMTESQRDSAFQFCLLLFLLSLIQIS